MVFSFEDKIKLVVTDMDGTLLNSNKQVTKDTVYGINQLTKTECLFTICTGRIPAMTEYYTNTLALQNPIVAANGAVIWDPVKKRALWESGIDDYDARLLFDYCKEQNMDYSALTLDGCFFSKNSRRREYFVRYNKIAKTAGMNEIILKDFDDNHECVTGNPIHKILIYERDSQKLEQAKKFINQLSKTDFTSSDAGLLDVLSSGVSKGIGVKRLADILDISLTQTCTIGDFENDISMFLMSKYSAAMGNACESAKKAARYVTKSNDEDGVLYVLEQIRKQNAKKG